MYNAKNMSRLTTLRIVSAIAAAILVVSCMPDMKVKMDVQQSSFAQMVGGIDMDQTWNLATKGSVTVSSDSPITVRVYAGGITGKLVANVAVNGTKTIAFDCTSDVEDLTVINMNGGEVRKTTLDGAVTFGKTKGAVAYNNGGWKVEQIDEYTGFNFAKIENDIDNIVPGLTKETADQLFYSTTGSFTLYPVWIDEESFDNLEIGIFYYDEGGNRVQIPVYRNMRNEGFMMIKDPDDSADPGYYNGSQNATVWRNTWTGWKKVEDFYVLEAANYHTLASEISSATELNYMTQGIKVTVPENTVFGFTVSRGNKSSLTFYSDEMIPTDFGYLKWTFDPDHGTNIPSQYVYGHAHTFSGEYDYIGFDGWCGYGEGKLNPDYKRFVFAFSDLKVDGKDVPEPIPGQAQSFILACEDLGENCDYDFNDVVLKITHVAGETTAHLTLLAAGSTLENYIYYGDQKICEVHEAFGVKTTDMVNTFSNGVRWVDPVDLGEITVPEDFTMTDTDMGGFKIIRGAGAVGVVAAPDKGSVPYMICVPNTWRWPYEQVRITDAYGRFASWCNDHNTEKEWYLYYVPELVFGE